MTIKNSGTLGFNEINAEFNRGTNLNAYRGTNWYSDNGVSYGTFNVNNISFSEFYSKRGTAFFVSTVSLGYTRTSPFVLGYAIGDFLVGPSGPYRCYNSNGQCIQYNNSNIFVVFPNGRPTTYCRIIIDGITDGTTATYGSGYYTVPWTRNDNLNNTTRTTTIYLYD